VKHIAICIHSIVFQKIQLFKEKEMMKSTVHMYEYVAQAETSDDEAN
jgi:hypothetical protein